LRELIQKLLSFFPAKLSSVSVSLSLYLLLKNYILPFFHYSNPHKSSMKQQACTPFSFSLSLSLKCSAPPTLILKGNKYSNKKNEDFSELFLLCLTNANEIHS
jgi:hypothetical protein